MRIKKIISKADSDFVVVHLERGKADNQDAPSEPDAPDLFDLDTRMAYYTAMRSHGGSFMQALAETMMKADGDNLRRIVREWGDSIIGGYTKFVILGGKNDTLNS